MRNNFPLILEKIPNELVSCIHKNSYPVLQDGLVAELRVLYKSDCVTDISTNASDFLRIGAY